MTQYHNILSLSEIEVKQYFLNQENYCTIPLPPYFQFGRLLQELNALLHGKKRSDYHSMIEITQISNVNLTIYHSKDGCYQWRPLQLIHPVLYIELLNLICTSENWATIQRRFLEFQKNPKITVTSIPVLRDSSKTSTATTVLNWWERMEQEILAESLNFSYILTTDITDFYPSIYTHSISWVLHGKEEAQKNRFENGEKQLGDRIDCLIQDMQHRQTNGIPQGSTLMDFIGEMILGYADKLLSEILSNNPTLEYRIFRYRDDYKILVNNPKDGEKILKILTEVLLTLNLKLNASKTMLSNDIISSAIKKDKLAWIQQNSFMDLLNPSYRCRVENKEWQFLNLQKTLLGIYQFAKQYPNSGTISRLLSIFSQKLTLTKKDNIMVLISLLTTIMVSNPKSYPQESALLSRLLKYIPKKERLKILKNIKIKLEQKTHTDFLDIWFQRISWKINPQEEYEHRLCKVVMEQKTSLWNNDWLNSKVNQIFLKTPIVDRQILVDMPEYITEKEVNQFLNYPY